VLDLDGTAEADPSADEIPRSAEVFGPLFGELAGVERYEVFMSASSVGKGQDPLVGRESQEVLEGVRIKRQICVAASS
jgi:hypothetical protein